MTIKSETVVVNRSAEEIFTLLADLNNLQQLMPQDRISDWESTTDSCSFKITGLSRIGMKIGSNQPNTLVNMVSEGKNPFPFELDVKITEQGDTCSAYLEFRGQANSFLSMMVSKPLTNFFNMLASKLKAIHE